MGSLKAPFCRRRRRTCNDLRRAEAADLLPPAPAMEPPAPVEFSGWYLLARRRRHGAADEQPLAERHAEPADRPAVRRLRQFLQSDHLPPPAFSTSASAISTASWLRFDVTGEYRGGAHFQALEQVANAPPDAGANLGDFYRGNLSSFILMANGYVDIGVVPRHDAVCRRGPRLGPKPSHRRHRHRLRLCSASACSSRPAATSAMERPTISPGR